MNSLDMSILTHRSKPLKHFGGTDFTLRKWIKDNRKTIYQQNYSFRNEIHARSAGYTKRDHKRKEDILTIDLYEADDLYDQ
jgi:hypothetical protein